jgi:hypothetical protein
MEPDVALTVALGSRRAAIAACVADAADDEGRP